MPQDKDHHHGFAQDLPRLIGRRGALAVLGGLGLTAAARPVAALDCVALPWETAGPYPADGTNRAAGEVVNVLTQSGVIREDIRASFNGMTPVAEGVPLVLDVLLSDAAGCGPLAGHAIYVWQCDAEGRYSLYNLEAANYLRGVGISDARGRVRFRTIFPGCYPGRWPHIHFEVFASAEAAVSGEASLLTAQIVIPEGICAEVYARDARYAASQGPLSRVSLSRDGVFGDNSDAEIEQQTPAVQGDPVTGYIATLAIPVDFAVSAPERPMRGGPGRPPPRL